MIIISFLLHFTLFSVVRRALFSSTSTDDEPVRPAAKPKGEMINSFEK